MPVAKRRERAAAKARSMAKRGVVMQPIEIEGRTIARSFWGKGWCQHLESFADYSNRLPRGRTYVRNGSVCHLTIESGKIAALVSGSSLYKVEISVARIRAVRWASIKARSREGIGSLLELLRGQLSERVMAVVGDREHGMFPQPNEIDFACSCPDWATLCKHVAAVLYGVGNRFDFEPELLFVLRGADPTELITSAAISLPLTSADSEGVLADDSLGEIFGIDLDADALGEGRAGPTARNGRAKKAAKRRALARKRRATPKPCRPRRITGYSVARLRRQLRMTLAEFAAEVSVSASTVVRWEGTRGPLTLVLRTRKQLEVILG